MGLGLLWYRTKIYYQIERQGGTQGSTMNRKLFTAEVRVAQLPTPPAPEPIPGTFALFPVALFPAATVEQLLFRQWLYLRAFEEAQAVARPSLPERDLLAYWN